MKRAIRSARLVPGGDRLFQRIFTRLGCQGRPPHFTVEFYPYASLTLTIRIRDDAAHVRLSDVLRAAAAPVLEGAAAILIGRIYRRRPPLDLVEAYRRFSYARSTRGELLRIRRRRARRLEHRPAGAHHDLAPLFARLNRRYFGGSLALPHLGWSTRTWRTQLGCFDPALNHIVINRQLDGRGVPEYVIAYVLYHEMLHLKHPIRFARCRRESHSLQFRQEEKSFEDYARAMRFLSRFPARQRT